MSLVAIVIAASAAAQSVPAPANPLAITEKGFLQCYRPDLQNKTCLSIAAYKPSGPDTYDNKALIPISKNATLETHTLVVLKEGAVCGSIRREDMTSGLLRVDNREIDPITAKPFLERIAQAMAPFAGKEICTRYEVSGDGFTAKVTIDGTYRPDQDQSVIWVSLSDGYTVTP